MSMKIKYDSSSGSIECETDHPHGYIDQTFAQQSKVEIMRHMDYIGCKEIEGDDLSQIKEMIIRKRRSQGDESARENVGIFF